MRNLISVLFVFLVVGLSHTFSQAIKLAEASGFKENKTQVYFRQIRFQNSHPTKVYNIDFLFEEI